MISLQGKGLRKSKGHTKSNSTDTLNSNKRTRFLSVVSAGPIHASGLERPSAPPIKTVSQLKRMAMGHRSTRSSSQQCSQAFAQVDTNQKKIPSRFSEERWKKQQQNKKKPGLVELSDWNIQLSRGLQTPIKKLLFESQCKENWFD